MRFIDLERLEPHIRGLLPPLEEAHQRVMVEQDPVQRRDLIEQYRGRWIALRDAFDAFSDGKCWYVECRNPGNDNEIDHFRPKLSVKEDPSILVIIGWLLTGRTFGSVAIEQIVSAGTQTRGQLEVRRTIFPSLNPTSRARTPPMTLPTSNLLSWTRPSPSTPRYFGLELTARSRCPLRLTTTTLPWRGSSSPAFTFILTGLGFVKSD